MHILMLKTRRNASMLKMLCGERRTVMALLLADAGYLKRISDGKYLLQCGS